MQQNIHRINQGLLVQRPFSSKTLQVLTTLIHRFSQKGDYDLFIRRDGQLIHRALVQVVTDNAPHQIDIDMAALAVNSSDKQDVKRYAIKTIGALCFYASQGMGSYTVMLIHLGKKHKEVVLDSSRQLPAGDFFAVTPVEPGVYRVTCSETNSKAELQVLMPKQGDEYRPDRPVLLSLSEHGFERDRTRIIA